MFAVVPATDAKPRVAKRFVPPRAKVAYASLDALVDVNSPLIIKRIRELLEVGVIVTDKFVLVKEVLFVIRI